MKKFEFIKTLLENYGHRSSANFGQLDDEDIKEYLGLPAEHELTLDDVEEYASDHGLPSSNEMVKSQFFDANAPSYNENDRWDDRDWLRQDYHTYVDSLNKGGQLHDLQTDYDIDDDDIRNAKEAYRTAQRY